MRQVGAIIFVDKIGNRLQIWGFIGCAGACPHRAASVSPPADRDLSSSPAYCC